MSGDCQHLGRILVSADMGIPRCQECSEHLEPEAIVHVVRVHRDTIDALSADLARVTAERDALRAAADDIIDIWENGEDEDTITLRTSARRWRSIMDELRTVRS
jgi:hypothetical protein